MLTRHLVAGLAAHPVGPMEAVVQLHEELQTLVSALI
jgi:hypothetical protein